MLKLLIPHLNNFNGIIYGYDDRMIAHKQAFMFNNYNRLCMFRSINYN